MADPTETMLILKVTVICWVSWHSAQQFNSFCHPLDHATLGRRITATSLHWDTSPQVCYLFI